MEVIPVVVDRFIIPLRAPAVLAAVALLLAATGCREHQKLDQVARAARSGGDAASALTDYYQGLDASTDQYALVFKVRNDAPVMTPQLQKSFADLHTEIRARRAVGAQLSALYKALGDIAADKPDDVQAAAQGLRKAIENLDGHPLTLSFDVAGAHTLPPGQVTPLMNGLISSFEDLQKIRDVKRGNADVLAILTAVQQQFASEKGMYVSLNSYYIKDTRKEVNSLVGAGLITPKGALEAAVKPFSVTVNGGPATANGQLISGNALNVEEQQLIDQSSADADAVNAALVAQEQAQQSLAAALGGVSPGQNAGSRM